MADSNLYQSLLRTFTINGQPMPDWISKFQHLEIHKTMNSKADRAVLTFVDVPIDMVRKAALVAQTNLGFKWGNGGNTSIPHDYVCHACDTKYLGDKAIVKLHLIDHRIHMMANSAFASYPHKSFSDIVKAVAASYSHLPAAVVAADKWITDVVQTGVHHWAFLSALLREGTKTVNNGLSDFRLFFKGGNELHFHPPDYTQAPKQTIPLFCASFAPEVKMRHSPWKPIVRGAKTKVSTVLRDEGKPHSNASTAPPSNAGASVKAVLSTMVGAFEGLYHLSHHQSSDLVDKTSEVAANTAISDGEVLEVPTQGLHGIDPGDVIAIQYPGTGAHGNYIVEEAYTSVGSGENVVGKSKFLLTRIADSGGSSSGSSPTSGQYSSGGSTKTSQGTLGYLGNDKSLQVVQTSRGYEFAGHFRS